MDSTMWNERYETAELIWGAGPNQFLPPLVSDMTPGTALDVACGEGRNAIWLASEGWDVTAVDFSEVGIAKAKTLARDTEVSWVVADVTTYRPDRRFDLVVLFYLHLPDAGMRATFDHALAALEPGGVFFGVGHALRNLTDGHGGPPVAEILWTDDRIRPLVEGLDVVELGERLRRVDGADRAAIDFVVHAHRPLAEA